MEWEESNGHGEVQPTQIHGNFDCQLSNSAKEILDNPEMFDAHLESIDREIGKFLQNSTIGLDGDMDQEEGHTNMNEMDGDYVD